MRDVLTSSHEAVRPKCPGAASYRQVPPIGTAQDKEDVMPQYMCLLYASEADEATRAERWAELPLWLELTDSLREAGLLVSNGPLHPAELATTVRVRDGETEITDGPFAVTKEELAGYYILDCSDLDEALGHAARLPTARHGAIEVRPIMSLEDAPRAEPA
jgi:hypothetical protein